MLYRLIIAVAIALTLPTVTFAHDRHKLMGTVTMVAADHVMMKTPEGKEVTIGINAKTKIFRGKIPVKITEVKEGTRIVAAVSLHTEPFTASQINVGKATETSGKK